MIRKGVLCTIFLFLMIFLYSCEQPKESIKIGLSINLSGRGGTAGEYIRDGAFLAVEHINEKGGINGHPLELLVRDDKNTEEGVLAADKELIDKGVIAIVGHSYSQNTLIAYPYVTSRNTLLITPYTATSKLTDIDDLFCRTCADNKMYGRALASLLKSWQVNNISFLMDMSNAGFVEDFLLQTEKYFSGTTNPVRFNSKEKNDWDEIIARLMMQEPEAIVLLTEVTMTGFSAQKLRAKGFQGELLATLWAQTPDLLGYGSRAVGDMSLITYIDPDNKRFKYQVFQTEMKKRFNRPASARAVRSYEIIQIIAEALKCCPFNATSVDLKKALLKNKFETLMGAVDFNEFCDVVRPVYEVRVMEKEFFTAGEIKITEGKN